MAKSKVPLKLARITTPVHFDKTLSPEIKKRSPFTLNPDKPLTENQLRFVKNWASGDSIGNAYLRAGFDSPGTTTGGSRGYQLVKQPNIIAAYQREKAKYEEASQMTRKKVMDMLLESYETAKLMAEPASMVAAAREVGKMCGYYAPVETRVKVDVTGNIVMNKLNNMTDQELLEVISRGQQQAEPELLQDESE